MAVRGSVRCFSPPLTGHELGENVGMIDANLEDIRYVLSRNCR